MSVRTTGTTVTVDAGTLRGFTRGSSRHFRGVPYARAVRFEEPQPVLPWAGERDATEHGPICPQPESLLEQVMGSLAHAASQAEDCLTLTITAPLGDDHARPVMVWLHGGAYILGAGSHAWYEADTLAEEQGVVVVRVNYRLGALGYLHLPGVSPPNLGLRDQIAALRWVHQNIAAFGGDPACVTLFGESAGAHAIASLMSTDGTRGLFQRAILQSPHLGVGFTSQARARRVAQRFVRELRGKDPATCTPDVLIEAQLDTMIALSRPFGLVSTPCFGPIAGLSPIATAHALTTDPARTQPQVDVIIGTTRDEMRSLFGVNPLLQRVRSTGALGASAFDLLSSLVTRQIFTRPAREFADRQAGAGARVYTYAFHWSAPGVHWGACHTIDLAFVLGDEAAWRDAPMLGGAWESTREVAGAMRAAWANFARTGDPNARGDGSWPRHRVGAGVGRTFA